MFHEICFTEKKKRNKPYPNLYGMSRRAKKSENNKQAEESARAHLVYPSTYNQFHFHCCFLYFKIVCALRSAFFLLYIFLLLLFNNKQ